MNKYIKFWRIAIAIVIGYIIVAVVSVVGINNYNKQVRNLFEQSINDNVNLFNSLKIVNSENSKTFQVVINDETQKILHSQQQNRSDDFMHKYYEVQSNWLNTWLMALAIILAFMAIIIPILCLKVYEKQESQLDGMINKAREETDKTAGARNSLQEYIEKEKQEMDFKLSNMQKDVNKVRDFVQKSEINELLSRANLKIQQKEYKEAIELCDTILEMDQNNFVAMSLKGISYGLQKNYQKSIDSFSQALGVVPNDIRILLNRSFSYIKNNEFENAIKDCQSILKIAPNNIEALQNIVYSYIKLKKYDEAVSVGEQMLVSYPDNKQVLYNLIEAYLYKGFVTKALEYVKKYKNLEEPYIIDDDLPVWKQLVERAEVGESLKSEINTIIDSLGVKPRAQLEQ